MYKPVKDGIPKSIKSVVYVEQEPPAELADTVHCFWELKTLSQLPEDFLYHVIPDACVNILFDQNNKEITAITLLQAEHKVLNLGRKFHFVGIQLLPGMWQGDPEEVQSDLVQNPYLGNLPLVEMNKRIISQPQFSAKSDIFADIVQELIFNKLIVKNEIVATILGNIENIQSVSDMASLVNLSSRQLQRNIHKYVGVSPHDFLKIVRLQQSFRENYLDYYSDQSHYIHSFRKLLGYTPTKFKKNFDV